jgi:hypothetical protein
MIGSGIIIVISLIMIGLGAQDGASIDVENSTHAIFQGTSGSVSVEEYGIYTIFVEDHYRCDETTVSITDGTTEFFTSECDSLYNEDGWRAIGVMETDLYGELSVTANHEILIVDDLIYIDEGTKMWLGGGLCCIGIFGLVVGIVMAFKQKDKGGVQHVIIQQPMMQQQQQPMQQQYQQAQQPVQQQYQQAQQPVVQQQYQQAQQPVQQQYQQAQQPVQQQYQQPPNDS